MENESVLGEDKETVIEQDKLLNGNGHTPSGLSLKLPSSPDEEEEKLHPEESLLESKPIDYSNLDKKDFVGLLKEAAANNDFKRAEALIREIKPLFDDIRHQERTEALIRFKKDGGIDEDFDYKGDEWDHAFDSYLKSIRENRQRHFRELEDQKNLNLQLKTELLERFRQLVDGEDSEHALRLFKDIQNEWKVIGPVAPGHVKTLWANYNALVDRFYDQRSIYFELKELDRKKNLELKQELCVRAERLLEVENLSEAVKELNELHNEFRHIGPVPIEDKDLVWQKFKAASDAVYSKRDVLVAKVQIELQDNFDKKEKINEEVALFANFQTDRIKEWNQKTREIIEIQKQWEAIGGVPRTKTRTVNKKFWGSFKSFFHNKNAFFKKLDEERSQNLALKTELLNKAIELKDSLEFEKASHELKALQVQWKAIGPVPEKQREKIFQEFKEACDFFFEKRRSSMSGEDKEQHENLIKKEEVIGALEQIQTSKMGTLDEVRALQKKFMSIGFVPKRSVASIKARFAEAVNQAIAALPLGESEKERATLEVQVAALRQGPQGDKKIHNKEHHLRKQISKAENDIAVLRNNLEFFGRSKNAEKLKEEFTLKINDAGDEILQLKKQLKILQAAE